MGFEPSAAGGVLVWTNVGGASGALVFSALTQRFGLKRLIIGSLCSRRSWSPCSAAHGRT
jgi:MFS-type transporter involved in bile tolerance (Atg22 family)